MAAPRINGIDTRTRIMYEASLLFATRGYYGTSTREIADAVGVRQPTLFYYFPAKHDIFAELLNIDLAPALTRVRNALALGGPAAPRLHAYLQVDVRAILELPYDIRGLYDDEVLRLPELKQQADQRELLHELTRQLVAQGNDSGEFEHADPSFTQLSITALVLESLRADAPTPQQQASKVADFVLRAIIADKQSMPAVQQASARLMSQI